jgi:hypothetical protein
VWGLPLKRFPGRPFFLSGAMPVPIPPKSQVSGLELTEKTQRHAKRLWEANITN